MTIRFEDKIEEIVAGPLKALSLETLQVNLGYLCNLECRHCHLSAGPNRKELMSSDTVSMVLEVLKNHDIGTLDITGGSPELHPDFRRLVSEASEIGCNIILRTNLTLLTSSEMTGLPDFLAQNKVVITASLPCYLKENVTKTRGDGTFELSIASLKKLNEAGYGIRPGLPLNLVYNPAEDFLAPSEQMLDGAYRRELSERFGIAFTRLYAFNNMPLGRFRDFLVENRRLDAYSALLLNAFNASTLNGLMCRRIVNVRWDGALYDCDFNQALGMGVLCDTRHIRDFRYEDLAVRRIAVSEHCWACTAGQGFTCAGSIL